MNRRVARSARIETQLEAMARVRARYAELPGPLGQQYLTVVDESTAAALIQHHEALLADQPRPRSHLRLITGGLAVLAGGVVIVWERLTRPAVGIAAVGALAGTAVLAHPAGQTPQPAPPVLTAPDTGSDTGPTPGPEPVPEAAPDRQPGPPADEAADADTQFHRQGDQDPAGADQLPEEDESDAQVQQHTSVQAHDQGETDDSAGQLSTEPAPELRPEDTPTTDPETEPAEPTTDNTCQPADRARGQLPDAACAAKPTT
jgi:hypothetical protein